jgi:hypothetical protein
LVRPVVPTSDNTDDGGDEHGRRGHRHRVATTTTQQRRKGHDEQQYQPAQQCRPDQLVQSQQAALVGVGPVVRERQPERNRERSGEDGRPPPSSARPDVQGCRLRSR